MMIKARWHLMLMGLLTAGCSQSGDMDIFILAGQSNMSGRADVSATPPPRYSDQVWVYTNAGKWEQAREPLDDATGQMDSVSADAKAGLGPGLAFAERLHELTGRRIGLVPCAKGGSAIDEWKQAQGRDTLYGSCIARAMTATGKGTLRGLLWYQGESDARPGLAESWGAKMEQLTRDFRQDLKAPDLPIVITVLSPKPVNDPRFPGWEDLQRQQAAMRGPYLAVVSAADLQPQEPKSPHLDAKSYVTLGKRYAEAMAGLLAH